jgi:hypothetical protein
MESFILDGLTILEDLDFMLLTRILAAAYMIFWLFVVGWVWFDASERYKSIWLRIAMTLLVLVLNIFGFLIYLVLRPKVTLEDAYWVDLERKYLQFEAAGLEDCPRCGGEVLPNFIHCPKCGCELRVKCKGCDVYLEPDWNVCPFCGEKQKDVNVSKMKKSSKKPRKKVSFFKKVVLGYDGMVKFLGKITSNQKSAKVDKKNKDKVGKGKTKKKPEVKGRKEKTGKKSQNKDNKQKPQKEQQNNGAKKEGGKKDVESKNADKKRHNKKTERQNKEKTQSKKSKPNNK